MMMTEKIYECTKCGLCCNQKPLLDVPRKCQIFWVGLSAKMVESTNDVPLSPNTNTGSLIQKIEEKNKGISTYKTNLVKCVPLTDDQKLRYPSKLEIKSCFDNLIVELNEMAPRIVFLLGEKVYSSVGNQLKIDFQKWNNYEYHFNEYSGMFFVPIHHPSYIYVYKRKNINEYIEGIENIISKLL